MRNRIVARVGRAELERWERRETLRGWRPRWCLDRSRVFWGWGTHCTAQDPLLPRDARVYRDSPAELKPASLPGAVINRIGGQFDDRGVFPGHPMKDLH